ncbi:MAG TPA: hypothetical protein VF064_16935 [Pyrinomonadaceae bacterium]
MSGTLTNSRVPEDRVRHERRFIGLTLGFVLATVVIFVATVCGVLVVWVLLFFLF